MDFPRVSASHCMALSFPTLPSLPTSPKDLVERISPNWRDVIVGTGVVVAVIGAVTSFFMSMAAAGIAFSVVSALLLYSAYYVHNFNAGAAIQDDINVIKKDNDELKAAQTKLQASAADLTRQYAAAQTLNHQLNQTVTSLQAGEAELRRQNTAFSQTNQGLQNNVQTLQQTNQQLQQKITQLQQAIPLLKDQIANFTKDNVDFGQSTKVLATGVSGLSTQNQALANTIKGFDMTFDKDVLDLSQEVHRAQEVSKTILASFNQKKADLEAQVQRLSSSATELNKVEEDLKQRTQDLRDLQTKIGTETTTLGQVQLQLTDTKDALDREKQAFEAERVKFTQIQINLQSEEQKLEQAKKSLESFATQLSDAETTYKKELSEIEAQKQGIEKKYDEKIEAKRQQVLLLNEEIKKLKQQLPQTN